MSGNHTIVLVQPAGAASRTYYDYESVNQAMDGLCTLYQNRLVELNPDAHHITYNAWDLYQYLQSLKDLSILVRKNDSGLYVPHDREWIQKQVYRYLDMLRKKGA